MRMRPLGRLAQALVGMRFVPKSLRFPIVSLPFAVVGAMTLLQAVPAAFHSFSARALSASLFCTGMVWIWLLDCRRYANHPVITVAPDGVSLGESYIPWSAIKALRFVARSLNPRVEVELEPSFVANQPEDFCFPETIQTDPYRGSFRLVRELKSAYESARPGATFSIPSSPLSFLASRLVALAGSTALVLVLFIVVGILVWGISRLKGY